ncbi:MAG: bifunctional nuclease family protein [Candidatus Omnitrophica bacterium]|nr:bifunctional nuclease family protein [Candidatus Omnitrophota bacterium]
MIRVELSKIIIDEKRQDQVIVLKEKDGDRQFPIIIGLMEASSIKMELAKVKSPRPLAHDLLYSVTVALDAKVESLAIDKMVKGTFYAKLILIAKDGTRKVIDCRPSDGIALAGRASAPIFVSEEVMKNADIYRIEE